MGRKKVKLELIAGERARRTTFNKRRSSLLKKASELSTLCGVEGCLIIYGPSPSSDHEAQQPAVWPSAAEARRVAERFRGLPAKKQGKNMLGKEDYAATNLSKMSKRLEREQEKNGRIRREQILSECVSLGGSLDDHKPRDLGELEEVGCFLDEGIKVINERIEVLQRRGNNAESATVSDIFN